MPKNQVLFLIAGGIILLLGYNQYTLNTKLQQETLFKQQENEQQNTKYCLDKIEPKLEKDIRNIAIGQGRGCFLEAGCMQGVTDPNYSAKFDYCNDNYYKDCLADLEPVEDMKARAKKEMLDECLKDFN